MKPFAKIILVVICLAVIYAGISLSALYFIRSDFRTISDIKSAKTVSAAFWAAKRIDRNLKILYPFHPLLNLNPQFKKAIEDAAIIDQSKDLFNEFFAINKERRTLVLMQNTAELRPSGGFWGAYGTLLVENASVESFETADTYDIDKELIGQHAAPDLIKDIVGDEWRFWNANWSPDFKLSAEQGLFFLDQTQNPKYDNILALNLDFILSLLNLSGSVKLEGYDFEINADNFIEKMIYEPNSTAIYSTQNGSGNIIKAQEKNRLLGEIGRKSLERIIDQGKQKELAVAIFDALKNKNLILYSRDDQAQKTIEKLGLGGRINSDQSFIMVVDANLGSKLDLMIEKKMTLTKVGENKYQAEISYQNPKQKVNQEKQLFSNYRNLVRIYLPESAKVLEQYGGTNFRPPTLDKELNANYVSNMVILEPDQSETLRLIWKVLDNSKAPSVIIQPGSTMQIYTEL